MSSVTSLGLLNRKLREQRFTALVDMATCYPFLVSMLRKLLTSPGAPVTFECLACSRTLVIHIDNHCTRNANIVKSGQGYQPTPARQGQRLSLSLSFFLAAKHKGVLRIVLRTANLTTAQAIVCWSMSASMSPHGAASC